MTSLCLYCSMGVVKIVDNQIKAVLDGDTSV